MGYESVRNEQDRHDEFRCHSCHTRLDPDDGSCYKCGSAWDSADVAFQVLEHKYTAIAHEAEPLSFSIISIIRHDVTRGPVLMNKTRALHAAAWHAVATKLAEGKRNITIGEAMLIRNGLRLCGAHYIPIAADPCPICGTPAETAG